jgi:uncharacterized protein (TIGR03435 family)
MVRTMTRRIHLPHFLSRKILICVAYCIPFAVAQPGPPINPPSKPSTYAVVSIRPHKETSDGSRWWTPTGDGYAAKNVEPAQLIREAYDVQCSDQLVGLPAWTYEETFDIEAKLDEDALPAYQKLSEHEQRAQAALMLRPMLADRFKLQVHHETRVLPIYALIVAKSGFKLKQSQEPESLGMVTNRGRIYIRGGQLGTRFIVGLSNATGRTVVDKTGLTGWYDIDLKWTPDDQQGTPDAGPTLFTALEEQLGLKLVPSKGPVDVIVVDHIERPTEN